MITLPADLPADTIYLGNAPVGQAGQYYDGDLSFRLPMTTTPVNATDPDTPPGLTINEITINSVSNVPPGLSWEASQLEFDPAVDPDGCVKFCGTPLLAGLYEVEVIVTAQVFVLNQTTSFRFPILIEPAVSTTEGFALINNSGCGEVTVTFENNVPSMGNPGFSYFWDFGNGLFSLAENPVDQTYDEPGNYPVNYEAVIDTMGYFLTNVTVQEVGCTDLLNGPDLKIEVLGPDGELAYISDIINNAATPLTFDLNLSLEEGNYTLKVTDDDGGLGGADDDCGSVNFTRATLGTLTDDELVVDLSILHPVDTIRSTDTVTVFPQPEPPQILGIPTVDLCEGESLLLETDYLEGIQWYQDSLPVLDGQGAGLEVTENGTYWVVYQSPDGCQSVSEAFDIGFLPLPTDPVFVNEDNLLTLYDPGSLPNAYALQWYQDGVLVEGAEEPEYCADADGNYTLEVVDLITGCSNSYTQLVFYNPNFPNCVSAAEALLVLEGRIFPNPTTGFLQFEVGSAGYEAFTWYLYDGMGSLLDSRQETALQGRFTLDLSGYIPGFYWLTIRSDDRQQTWKVVKI